MTLIEPRRNLCASTLPLLRLPPQAQKHLLRHVFRLGLVPERPARNREHPVDAGIHEVLERLRIALRHPLHQRLIGLSRLVLRNVPDREPARSGFASSDGTPVHLHDG